MSPFVLLFSTAFGAMFGRILLRIGEPARLLFAPRRLPVDAVVGRIGRRRSQVRRGSHLLSSTHITHVNINHEAATCLVSRFCIVFIMSTSFLHALSFACSITIINSLEIYRHTTVWFSFSLSPFSLSYLSSSSSLSSVTSLTKELVAANPEPPQGP